MTIPLRQNTAKTLQVGPFYDPSNNVLTGLTIAQTNRQLSKNGGAFAQSSQTGNAAHDRDGFYTVTFSTADTDTVGPLDLQITMAGAIAVWREFYVYEEVVFDALYASGATGYSTHDENDVITPLDSLIQTLRNQQIIRGTTGTYSIPVFTRSDPYSLITTSPLAAVTSASVRIDDSSTVDILAGGELADSGANNGYLLWNYTAGSTNGSNLELLISGPMIVPIAWPIRTVPLPS